MNRTIELEIGSIAAGGDGVGRSDGLVVFVPRAAPGDVGRVRIEKAGRFARARWESIAQPGPSRIEPPCAHYTRDRCGGCQLQHMAYPAQLAAKADIVRDALQRIGKRTVASPVVRPSPAQWRYRRKLTLALRRRTVRESWTAGLHPYDDPDRVFDLNDCPITDERVLAVWRQVRRASEWFPPETALRAAVRVAADGDAGGTSFLLEGGTNWANHERFFAAVPLVDSLWWRPEGQGRRRLLTRSPGSSGDEAPRRRGAPLTTHAPDDADAQGRQAMAADPSFVQVNAVVAAELHAHVVNLALAEKPATVIDAYAGGGDTSVPLAEAGIRVIAIELDRDGASRGASRLKLPSRMIQGRVEDALPDLLPADVIILNPPRTGLHEQVTATLATGSPASTLIYVSCNPATLARDVARMPRYRIASLLSFDMFPQTAHVETVCALVPETP